MNPLDFARAYIASVASYLPDGGIAVKQFNTETKRLETLVVIQGLSRERGMSTPGEGYWMESWGPDIALIRWFEGDTEETVARLHFGEGRLEATDNSMTDHASLIESLGALGWKVVRFQPHTQQRKEA